MWVRFPPGAQISPKNSYKILMRSPLPKKNQYSNICIDEHQGAPLTLVFVFNTKEKDQLSGLIFFV